MSAEPPVVCTCAACGGTFEVRAASFRYKRRVRGESAYRYCSVQCFWDDRTGGLNGADTRTCLGCGEEKPKTGEHFAKHARGRDGLHPRCRECTNRRSKEKTRALRHLVLSHYSGGEPKCACCGESEWAFLALDHIGGWGAEQRRELTGQNRGGNNQIYNWIKRNGFPDGYRVLCHNCNSAIAYYGECPHEAARRAKARLSA